MSYIGPTPLSMLVEYKGQELYDQITNLLTDGSKWEPLWELVAPDGHLAQARELILALLRKRAASWQHRFLQHLKSFPLKLLVMIQKPGLEADPKRQQAAQDLLDKSACCTDSVHSDIAEKGLISRLIFHTANHMKTQNGFGKQLDKITLPL